MKVAQLHEWTPKQFLSPILKPKNIPIGPQKVKTTQKLSQNRMSELKEIKKMKVIQLNEQTPKLVLNPTPT